MNRSIMLFIVVMVMVLFGFAESLSGIKGDISSGNFRCKFQEIKSRYGSGPREMKINCQYTDRRCKSMDFSCTYKGNPHPCAAYNKKQAQFYRDLATVAAAGLCKRSPINAKKICQDIDFNLQSSIGRRKRGIVLIPWLFAAIFGITLASSTSVAIHELHSNKPSSRDPAPRCKYW